MATNERERERERERVGPIIYIHPIIFYESSFWYLRDLNPGERNRERERDKINYN